jgi:hypothetical protein
MLIISAKSGQLGNRLLLFANFIAFAIENKFIVLNPAFEEYADFFKSTHKDILCCYPTPLLAIPGNKKLRQYYYNLNLALAKSRRFNTIELKRDKPFNWKDSNIIAQLKSNSLNFFKGWLFRDGWFVGETENLQKHGDAIRAYFQPLKIYQENVAKLILNLKNETDILIGVHIRQGDYRQHQNGRYFYESEQYVKVMELAQALFPHKKVTFLICSNEKQSDYFQQFSYVYGNNHIIEDMYALAECDYIIGPPSSYTMWASFYGDKPLYMIRDVNQALEMKSFVHFYQWQGIFHSNEDWSKSFWEWTH